ncbi:YD repeat-containing protein [Larkinella arboricola]|uniref:YD repeat-containing protein n=1 Tax=Larkinella arboricola TaxID=643671 RepID=A0A327X2A6_LARAB|nr:hypothetical protein [Larkinella arboricola]RAK00516.1 YD repeat-containing protein [Larkinella arboricola]
MQTLIRYFLPACFILLFGSCTVQDHLPPSESSPCRISLRLSSLNYHAIQPGETVTLGAQVEGWNFTPFIVRDIQEINGISYAIGWKDETYRIGAEESNTSYEYDAQGRVIKTVNRLKRPTADITNEYTYTSPTRIDLKYTPNYFHYPVPPSYNDSYTLNSQGMVIDRNVTYDAEGYVIRRGPSRYTIENGNLVRADEGGNITLYEYDLTRPNPVPDPVTFFGKSDRNLRTDMHVIIPGVQMEFDLYYIYDNARRLKYQIQRYSYADDPRIRLQINGYEWTCPQ